MKSRVEPRGGVRTGAATLALLLMCGGRVDQFTIEQRGETTVAPGTLVEQLAGDLGFEDLVSFDLNDNEELRNQGVRKEEIDSIFIQTFSLRVTEPQGGDLTFLDSVSFYVSAAGLDRVLIATGGPFSTGESEVELTLPHVDLTPYAAAPTMTVSSEITGHRPATATRIEAVMKLQVDVNVTGAACGR